MKNNLNWFSINPLEPTILGQKDDLKYNLKVRFIIIKESDEVESLKITTDKALNSENILKNYAGFRQTWKTWRK